MLHTYLICSMEPELYDYENEHADDHSEDDYEAGVIAYDGLDNTVEEDWGEDDDNYLDGDYKDEDNVYHKYNADW